MLRPATPLSILLVLAFGLLLISVLSTPIIKSIPLGSFNGVKFGVFGWCRDTTCSPIEIGYDTSAINNNGNEGDFDLPSSTRSTLSAILIIHPVAALITLVMLILALVSHLHSPSHSSRYLLLVFILSIIDLIVCLLSFLIDVLLFVPHMAFGSYLVLAATILVALSTLVSCAMRRTIVNRKARKKRINENAEMSGENFYNRQAKETPMPTTLQSTIPAVSEANAAANDSTPAFASFEKKGDRVSDERIPLTARSPADRSPNNLPVDMNSADTMYNGPIGPGPRRAPSRDQFGNPIGNPGIPPPDAYGMRRPSTDTQRSRGRGGMPPGGYRGRGGYGPPRGGYGPGPGPGRGGYGPPGGRGGYGPPPNRGGYGPPPRGYGGPMMRGGRPPPPPPSYDSGPYDRRGSPAAEFGHYGARQQSPGPPSAPGYQMNNLNPSPSNLSSGPSYEAYTPGRETDLPRAESPGRENDLPRAESPPPLPGMDSDIAPGQAATMHAPGSPAHSHQGFGLSDGDADIAGMVGLQQGRETARRHETVMSEGSKYSQPDDQYVPVRTAWNQGAAQHHSAVPSPLRPPAGNLRQGTGSPRPAPQETSYVEDIDPRFAEPPMVATPAQRPTPPALETDNSYDSIPEGARSPAESERSTFTSISQRGINPNWPGNNPPPQMVGGFGAVPPRRPVQPQRDILLDGNPNFMLPGGDRGGRGPRRGGGYPGGL